MKNYRQHTRRSFINRLPLVAAPVLLVGEAARADSPEEAGRFSVRKFGAKGDGVAKDTGAVQAAIDAAGKEGGCVYFQPGRYLCAFTSKTAP
jgi:polygalacturonase